MWIDDQILSRCHEKLVCEVFIPQQKMVVLGRSNQVTTEVNLDQCQTHGIQILRRRGGGGTVYLSEKSLVVSLGIWVKDYYDNSRYFQMINASLIQALVAVVPSFKLEQFKQQGISDITLFHKKVVGTSLFRSRNYLLYQASLLLFDCAEEMGLFLKHPSREPDYRGGRDHKDFVSCLSAHSDGFCFEGIEAKLQSALVAILTENFDTDWIAPVTTQMKHIVSIGCPST